jgi:anti-sigma B factor antagonist
MLTFGELDLVTVAALRSDLLGCGIRADQRVLGAVGRCLVVDLLAVTFMDCSPLGVLCTARSRAELGGGWLRLVYIQDQVVRLLAATGTDRRFPRYATVAEALADRPALPAARGSALH